MFKIAALISGGGSNLQSVIDAIEKKDLPAEIGIVISDREAAGLERAGKYGIPCRLLNRKDYGNTLSDEILKIIPADTDLILLAGYLSILSREFIEKWQRRIINIHPSLLPDFGGKGMYGMKVHQAVLQASRKESGCTVHYVDSGIDTGNILGQKTVPVLPDDTAEQLQNRVLIQEHILVVESIRKIIKNKQ
ncbi:MAG: phosphoribosylglycinamide formyltransferase [Spirochaetaceae bacterium 4572_59]|nr:MAG: phosphoribosylglycinamide formyltransferase [Spirochaetaceae bacterium 4572_59]